jgi:hypothetical protein
VSIGGPTNSDAMASLGWLDNTKLLLAQYFDDSQFSTGIVYSTNARVITATKNATSGSAAYLDGSSAGTSVNPINAITSTAGFAIGAVSNGNYYWQGYIQEIVATNSVMTTTDRQKFERNQGKFYGITVS